MILGVPRWYFWLSAALVGVLAWSLVATLGPPGAPAWAHSTVLPYTITWQRDSLAWNRLPWNHRTLPCSSTQAGEIAVAQAPGMVWSSWNGSKTTWTLTPGTYFAVRCQHDGKAFAWEEQS